MHAPYKAMEVSVETTAVERLNKDLVTRELYIMSGSDYQNIKANSLSNFTLGHSCIELCLYNVSKTYPITVCK
jgi:hypothetical protein